jgi:hypothetical protein
MMMDLVYKATSQYLSNHKEPIPRDGLFARQDIKDGDVICEYSGAFVDDETAKNMDSMYWFFALSFQYRKEFKYFLFGDDVDGTLGHYCNCLPRNSLQRSNARIDFKKFFEDEEVESVLNTTKRIKTFLIATRDILKDEEITMLYMPNPRVRLLQHLRRI